MRGLHSAENLRQVVSFIQKKAKGREIVIWGKGWLETEIMEILDVLKLLNVKFYISRDAEYKRIWREKPVLTFEESGITPEKSYVFLCVQSIFPEVRKQLKDKGFVEDQDFCDFESWKLRSITVF